MTFFTKLIWALTIMPTVCLLLACADKNDQALEEPQSKILSAYHGLDALPAGAGILCPIAVEGEDGMPVVFSVPIIALNVGNIDQGRRHIECFVGTSFG